MADKLTALDYITLPIRELLGHPDFTYLALQRAILVSNLTTPQLEGLTFEGVR